MSLRGALCSFLCLAGGLAAAELPVKIQRVLDGATGIRRGFLGLQIVNLETGAVLFESNAEHMFVPASNSKLFTTALGLTRLGPDYQFHTTVVASGEPLSSLRPSRPLHADRLFLDVTAEATAKQEPLGVAMQYFQLE